MGAKLMKTNSLSANLCGGSLKAKNALALIVGFRFFLFKPDKARDSAGACTANDGAVGVTNRKYVLHVVTRTPPRHSALFTANQSHGFTLQDGRIVRQDGRKVN
jgi:hypothetical protein